MPVRRGGLMLLWLALSLLLPAGVRTDVTCPAAPQNALNFTDIPQQPAGRVTSDAGALAPLYGFVKSFLGCVQPNPFPEELLRKLLNNEGVDVTKVARYEAGYIVCALLGLLFLFLMPLVGAIFACCRCCGRCGGRAKKDCEAPRCQRNAMITFLTMTTIVILAGMVLAFTANEKVTMAVDPSLRSLDSTLENLKDFTNSLPQKINIIVDQYSIPKTKIKGELDGIGRLIGDEIASQLNSSVTAALDAVSVNVKDIKSVLDSLQSIRDKRQTLQSRQPVLVTNLNERKSKLQQTLTSPACSNCQPLSLSADKLQIEADYSKISSVDSELNYMRDIAAYDLQGQIEKGKETFKNVPQMAINETSSAVQSIKAALDGIQPELDRLPFPSLSSATATITTIQLELRKQGPEVQRYDYIRWNVSIVLCCMILLIVLLNFLGLAFGIGGVWSRQDPGKPNCPSSSGANLLMASVGFSFLFSWLLILLVFVIFFVGGNVETIFCRNWKNQELFKFVDTPGNLPSNLDVTNAFGNKFNTSAVYNGCKAGQSLYTVLNLDQQFNLQKFLDVSKLSAEFTAKLGLLSVDLSGVQLLSDEGRKKLQEFRDVNKINDSFSSTELNKSPVQIDLLVLAAQLEKKASQQVDPLVKNNLTDEAQKLRDLQRDVVDLQLSDVAELNASLNALSFTRKDLQGHADQTLSSLDTVTSKLKTGPLAITTKLSLCFIDKALASLQQYLDWGLKMVAELLSCQSLIVSLDNIYTISCENVLNPWNAFWLSLGWCTLFLIPSIIFAVKTAKHFRAVRSSFKSIDLVSLDTRAMFGQLPRAKLYQ